MQGKIAVGEHFAIPDTTDRSLRYQTDYWTGLQAKLLDLHDRRLAEMDRTDIEIEIISLNSNGVQGILGAAKAAALELERCVRNLKFKGALLNGFSQVGVPDTAVYYDLPQDRPFWAVVERLGACDPHARRRPRALRRRLSVRGSCAGGLLVRCSRHSRNRPPQDRPRQRGGAVGLG